MSGCEKPFACTFPECSQKFVTEDSLYMHLEKHYLSLEGLLQSGHVFQDQTPTPTTLLRDCENFGLFQDLNSKNPFDESFRKAVVGNDVSLVVADEAQTPSIPILPDSAAILGPMATPTSGLKDAPSFLPLPSSITGGFTPTLNSGNATPSLDSPSQIPILDPDTSLSIPPGSHSTSVTEPVDLSVNYTPSDNIESNRLQKPAKKRHKKQHQQLELNQTQHSVISQLQPSASVLTVHPPAIASPQHVSSLLPRIGSSPPTVNSDSTSGRVCSESHVTVKQTSSVTVSEVSVVPAPMTSLLSNATHTGGLTLVFQLPNGEHSPAFMVSTQYQTAELSNRMLTAKQKLKETLTKEGHRHSAPQDSTYCSDLQEHLSSLSRESEHQLDSTKQSSRSDDDLNEDERRLKQLERNRAAARRCRKKKKNWIENLEQKVKQQQQVIMQLQGESAILKTEIVELKSLFLAHKDCAVFKKQVESGQLDSVILLSSGTVNSNRQATRQDSMGSDNSQTS